MKDKFPIHFHAVLLPDNKKFQVTVTLPDKRKLMELMTPLQFTKMATSISAPLVITGVTVVFDGPGGQQVERTVRNYLLDVLNSYLNARNTMN